MSLPISASPQSVAAGDGGFRIAVTQARISHSNDLHSTTCTLASTPTNRRHPRHPCPSEPAPRGSIHGFVDAPVAVQGDNTRAVVYLKPNNELLLPRRLALQFHRRPLAVELRVL